MSNNQERELFEAWIYRHAPKHPCGELAWVVWQAARATPVTAEAVPKLDLAHPVGEKRRVRVVSTEMLDGELVACIVIEPAAPTIPVPLKPAGDGCVSVDDAFPPRGSSVLAAANGVTQHVIVHLLNDKWFDTASDEYLEDFHPTHWQPLPAPPAIEAERAEGAV